MRSDWLQHAVLCLHSHELAEHGRLDIESSTFEAFLPLLELPLVGEHLFLDVIQLLLNFGGIRSRGKGVAKLALELLEF